MAQWQWQIEHLFLPFNKANSQTRGVTLAIPSTAELETTTVVYCTDGQVVETLAARLLLSSMTLHPPILIGVHSNPTMRAEEYLQSSNEIYHAHERFFTEDIRSWAHEMFGLSVGRENSVVFGFSNGGAFAIATALRHSDLFNAAIAFSVPAFGQITNFPRDPDLLPSVYLAAGNQGAEKSIRKNVLRLWKILRRNQIPVEYRERESGHELDFWMSEFVTAIDWFELRKKTVKPLKYKNDAG